MAETTIRLKRGSRKMQYLIDQYLAAHPSEGPDVSPYMVSDWAVDEGLYKPLPVDPKEQLRRLLSRSLRETFMRDPQGREVRANLPIIEEVPTNEGVKRRSRWFPLFQAPAKVARTSFSLRRRSALSDVVQLALDLNSYNDNNELGEEVDPLDYNFNKDLAEMAESTTYPEGPELEEEEEFEEEES